MDPAAAVIGEAEPQPDGAIHYTVRSSLQRGPTLVRLLLPKTIDPPETRRILFVLPVDPVMQRRWGDGLVTARKLDAANRFGFIVVAPTFADWPWYCDHPDKPALRQETYFLDIVVPLVARLHPHEASRRALVGFSKSGWGAFSLLLRHPKAFGAACAWDAPMMMERPRFEMGRIVGTQENFGHYRIAALLASHGAALGKATRLGLFGYGNFRADTQRAHALMERLGIPHHYADGPPRKHNWDSGWLEESIRTLRKMIP